MKKNDPIEKLVHSSGEDILISYRTGARVQVKEGKITKIYTNENHHELNWQLHDWKKREELAAAEIEQAQLKAFHKAAASAHAKTLKESKKAAATK